MSTVHIEKLITLSGSPTAYRVYVVNQFGEECANSNYTALHGLSLAEARALGCQWALTFQARRVGWPEVEAANEPVKDPALRVCHKCGESPMVKYDKASPATPYWIGCPTGDTSPFCGTTYERAAVDWNGAHYSPAKPPRGVSDTVIEYGCKECTRIERHKVSPAKVRIVGGLSEVEGYMKWGALCDWDHVCSGPRATPAQAIRAWNLANKPGGRDVPCA